ncbi:helix-turn-helix domain-containing protein [Thermaurantiacus tibetensis]|uniref:helix-turn-helix domain-containing protein n=1 Tax=Thermaurantiacus tibetensis TaxID=2759035 RepID=UPI00188E2378|nr:helix-turn-helix domain-containing protein [Thermaurantiacus tibetensis]
MLRIVSTLRRQCNLERLADLLVTLAGADLADGWRIEVPQADLAAMAALGRTTLVGTLRQLEEMGLVAVKYRGIVLRDAAALVALRDGAAGDAPARCRRPGGYADGDGRGSPIR